MKKVIAPKRGFFVKDLNMDHSGVGKYAIILYAKRGRFGNILSKRFKRKVLTPKGFQIASIENNKPKVGAVTIIYKKR